MVAPVSVFTTAILPIVAVGGVGYLLGSVRDVGTDGVNTVVVYVLAPALVFHSLVTTTLAALILVTAFPNTGNYGIPVSNFAFGGTGRATAVVALSVQAVLIYSLGVYIAGRGSGGMAADVRRVFGVPLVCAVVAALLARWLGVVPPIGSTVMSTLQLVGDSAIPPILLVVGIQLARTDVGSTLSTVGGAVGLKMVVAPVLGVGVALAVGFSDPVVARTFVLETAMPSAVTPVILVGEFAEGEVAGVPVAEFVSTAIFATTLVSVVTLTALIVILQAGVVV